MSKIFLPYAEQIDEMNRHLSEIVNIIGKPTIAPTGWDEIAYLVRNGLGEVTFPIGTQFKVNHSLGETGAGYGNMTFTVVAHDYYKNPYDPIAHTMTLMTYLNDSNIPFNAREAFYCVESSLPEGTYCFTIPETVSKWEKGTYWFVTDRQLQEGWQFCINRTADRSLEGGYVLACVNAADNVTYHEYPINKGKVGTDLGTFGVELNDTYRVGYGSNDYETSYLRDRFNTIGIGLTDEWTPATKYSRTFTNGETNNRYKGIIAGLPNEFSKHIVDVIVPCVRKLPNSTGSEAYTVIDRFYPPTKTELFGNKSGFSEDGTTQFPYYRRAIAADYVFADETTWWTRSPATSLYGVSYVDESGAIAEGIPSEYRRLVALCNIG